MAVSLEKPNPNARRGPRSRTYLGAKLVYGDGAFSLDCLMRDFSDAGARIKVPEGLPIPDQVFLVELRTGVAYEAEVVWRRLPEIGLKFLHQHDLANASHPHIRIMRRLWAEAQGRSGL
jgi:hypothetical protein